MKRTALVLSLAVLMSVTAKSQDTGIIDTVVLKATLTPDAQANQLKLKLELWVFNDEPLSVAGMGFFWDNPNLHLDSAVATALTTSGFAIGPFFYEGGILATTNTNNRCLFAGVATSTLFSGSAAGRRHWASYYFTLSSWDETDIINIDSLTFDDASTYVFVPESQDPFSPVWAGGLTIEDPNKPVDLLLSDDSLHFNSVQGAAAPPFQEFTITSSTGEVTPFTISENAPWLLVSPLIASTPRTIRVDINNIGVVAGSYIDTIEVNSTAAANTPLQVVVTLDVAPPPPTIAVTPNAFFFNAVANSANPAPKILTVKNSGGSILNWTLTKSQPWLNLTPMFGADSGDVELSIDITGLTLGTYRDTITVSAPGATNNPRKVPVTLAIASDLPVIDVDSEFNYVVIETDLGIVDTTSIVVRNGGAGSMNFWLETNSTRIYDIYPDTSLAPDTVNLIIRVFGPGDFFDTVWVFSNEASNSPIPVVFQFHYVETPAVISLSAPALNYSIFECTQGSSPLPPAPNFAVYNFGGDNPMNFEIVYESDLFTIGQSSGTAPDIIPLSNYVKQLPVGTYQDTVYIYAQKAINSPYQLIVTVNVIAGTATPQISLSDSSFGYTAQEDHGAVLPHDIFIDNLFGGCLEWEIVENIPWASVDKSSGNVAEFVLIGASSSGLTMGQYSDSFYISSTEASNSPKKIKLLFKIWKLHGDNNYDGKFNILDLAHSVNYFFRNNGILPQPERAVGDLNCDRRYDILDLNFMVNRIFRNGPEPCGNPFKK